MSERLSMWTVYDHPLDYPEHFVARRFEIGRPDEGDHGVIHTDEVMTSPMLTPLRETLAARGLTPLMRSDMDEPQIVEVWL